MCQKGAIAYPTLIAYEAPHDASEVLGLPPDSVERSDDVCLLSPSSQESLPEADVPVAYGSDVLGGLHIRYLDECVMRGRVLPPIKVIRSAICHTATLIGRKGKIAYIAPRGFADPILLEREALQAVPAHRPEAAHAAQ